MSKIIKYSADLKIVNLSALPSGTGAKFLVCVEGIGGALIAKAWKRVKPSKLGSIEVLVSFYPVTATVKYGRNYH